MVHGPPESILGVSYPGRWLRRGHQLASQSALNHNPHRRAVSPGKPKSGASMANPDPPLKMKRNIALLSLCQAVLWRLVRIRLTPPLVLSQSAIEKAARRHRSRWLTGAIATMNGAAACTLTGIPPTHANAFQYVADQKGCVISSRAVGIYAMDLIPANHASKGCHNKVKSCDWGPTVGFVLAVT